jgi:hypothetical protein
MKIICHLLVVIVVVCYSGLCSHASQPINKPESKQSSCHSQSSVEKPNTKNSDLQTLITNDNHSDPNCCIITLTNSPNNNYVILEVPSNSVSSFSPTLRDDIVFIEKFGNYSNKHDPPDVTLLKSSLLL